MTSPARSTKFLETERNLLLTDLVVAETLDVLESFYKAPRRQIAEAYLVACAESANVGRIASFDKAIDRVTTIERVEPP